jgi:hypothetical protein
MFIDVMGKYLPCIEEVLEDNSMAKPKQVLDLGCRSGAWWVYNFHHSISQFFLRILDVVRDFLKVNCMGVDFVPIQALWVAIFTTWCGLSSQCASEICPQTACS